MSALAHPWVAALGLAVTAIGAALLLLRRRRQRIPAPALARKPVAVALDAAAAALAIAGIAATWIAAAGPRRPVPAPEGGAGLDLVLLLDASGSMGARDAAGATRSAAAARVAESFLQARPRDRVAVIAFAGQATVLSPLTADHEALIGVIRHLAPGDLGRGTAVGDALAVALARLRHVPRGSAGIVLVSDGRSNAGALAPLTAARSSAERGVPVDAVAVGSTADRTEGADEPTLRAIAEATGGHFVRATDAGGVQTAFAELARLRPSPAPAAGMTWRDLSPQAGAWAAVLLLGAALLETGGGRLWG